MGHVKLKKASAFDVMPADSVVSIKLAPEMLGNDGKIDILFLGSDTINYTITPAGWMLEDASTHFVQADVDNLNEAVGLISGGSGMIDVSLSKVVDSIFYNGGGA